MPLLLVKYTLLSEKLPERDEAVEAVANRETEVCAKTFSNFVRGTICSHTDAVTAALLSTFVPGKALSQQHPLWPCSSSI